MFHIAPPKINPKRHYLNCISTVHSKAKKRELEEVAPVIADAAKEYRKLAKSRKLYTMKRHDCGISDKRMKRLYEYRMVDKGQPGREVYDRIILSAPNGFCPFCGQRRVGSIDHYLSKSEFPELATVPINLVPCCQECNKTKDTYSPSKRSEQLLHPYFDRVRVRWLTANIVESNGRALFIFSVETGTSLPRTLVKRIENHLHVLDLADLYSIHATAEMRDIDYQLEMIRSIAGPRGVKEHLLDQAKSRERSNPNSWKTAAYYAMHGSKDYCDGELKC